MKKTYISPRLFVIDAEAAEMICASKTYTLNRGTQWGTEGEYAPAEWKNEGYLDKSETIGGFSVAEFGDEGEEDLPSR
ncbi:MAG: hypothetical protein VZR36_09905 [Prevotella sp.]|nr:hypothetical protein [Prevotella sp.]